MDNNMNTGVPFNGAAVPQPQGDDQKQKPEGLKLDAKVIALAAVVVVLLLIILVSFIAGSGERKAKKAVKTYVQVFVSGDKKDNDVNWTKYYPKDFDRELEDWAKAYAKSRKSSFEDVEKYKVLSVSKLSGKDMVDILEDGVVSFFTGSVADYSGSDIDKRDLRDVKVSKGYLVVTEYEFDGDLQVRYWVVIKAGGRYGVYGSGLVISE